MCISEWELPRLLTPRIVQQAANVRIDHCDLFSFLPFEGDLVVGKVHSPQAHFPLSIPRTPFPMFKFSPCNATQLTVLLEVGEGQMSLFRYL